MNGALPHASPFRFVDRWAPACGRGATRARKAATGGEAMWAAGAEDGLPWPLSLLLECCAQAAGGASGRAEDGGLLAAVERFRVRGVVRAGDRLEVAARLERRLGRLGRFRCAVTAGGRRVADGTLVLAFGSAPRTVEPETPGRAPGSRKKGTGR